MEYLVIELQPQPKILCEYKHSNSECEPIIFKNKNDAFKNADLCKQGLVYPIVDIMKIFEQIKVLANNYRGIDILDELLAITDEII